MSGQRPVFAIRSRGDWDALLARCEALAAATGWPAAVWWRRGTGAVRLVCGGYVTTLPAGWNLAWEAGMPGDLAGQAWDAYGRRRVEGGGVVGDPAGFGDDAEIV